MPKQFRFGQGTVWPGVAKVLEEMGELAQPLGKLIMVEGRDEEHWSGPLRRSIVEESADVAAALLFLVKHNFTLEEQWIYNQRVAKKTARFEEWHREEVADQDDASKAEAETARYMREIAQGMGYASTLEAIEDLARRSISSGASAGQNFRNDKITQNVK